MRRTHTALFIVAAALFFSGFAGLIYQVAWIRKLLSITTATAPAQALVLAMFMGGLGLGSWISGRAVAHLRRPLGGYIAVELGALLFAFFSMHFVDFSTNVPSAFLNLDFSPSAALAGQLFVVGLYFLIPTTFLGMSLPLVVGHLERLPAYRNPKSIGKAMNIIYALNTSGALVGCFFAGYIAIEHFGLTLATWIGAACITSREFCYQNANSFRPP